MRFFEVSIKKLHTSFDTFYYITFTCFNWLNLFEITKIYDFTYEWFEILLKHNVYNCGYVITPNYLHLLAYTTNSKQTINKILGNGKRFMAYEIVKRLRLSGSVKLLSQLAEAVNTSERIRDKKHEVFQDSFDCKEIITEKFVRQKLNYT